MQNTPQNSGTTSSRRGLLFGAAVAGGAVVTVAALPLVQPQAVATSEPKPMPEKGGGYSLTEHVKHYYRTAQI